MCLFILYLYFDDIQLQLIWNNGGKHPIKSKLSFIGCFVSFIDSFYCFVDI